MIDEQKGIAEAEQLLEELDINTLPVIPAEIVSRISSKDFTVEMVLQNFSSEKFLGRAEGNQEAALIYINRNIPDAGRLNFTAAHEIGHVCMHIMPQIKMSFECGKNELSNSFDNPIEKQANGFASGLLMPRSLIANLWNKEITWKSLAKIKNECKSSLEAAFRRISLLCNEPFALVIHKDGGFVRFIASSNFYHYILRAPLSFSQKESLVDVSHESYPNDFDEADASDWVNPVHRNRTLQTIFTSCILLDKGFSYSLITYNDDCYDEHDY